MRLKIKSARAMAKGLGMQDADTASAAAIQKFLNEQIEQGVELIVAGKALDKTKKVTVAIGADAGEEVEVQDMNAPAEASEDDPDEAKMDGEEDEDVAKSADIRRMVDREVNRQMKRMRDPEILVNDRARELAGKGSVRVLGDHRTRQKSLYDAQAKQVDHKGRRKTCFGSADRAELFGAAFRIKATENGTRRDYAFIDEDRAILKRALGEKALATNVSAAAGVLVDTEFSTDVINLLDRYGVMRDLIGVEQMSNHTKRVPRRISDVNAAWEGEGSSGSAQNKPEFDGVTLTASKLKAIVQVTDELMNDSAIDIADQVADSIAVGHAYKEDLAAIDGDGTSTYGGFTGFRNKIASGSKSYVEATGNAWSSITYADFGKARGRIRRLFRQMPGLQLTILCSEAFAEEVIDPLQFANGRGLVSETTGERTGTFKGFRIQTSEIMPDESGSSQICALIGAFPLAAKFGQVRSGLAITGSEHVGFNDDLMTWKGVNRLAINVHEGDSTTVAGPVVALATTS